MGRRSPFWGHSRREQAHCSQHTAEPHTHGRLFTTTMTWTQPECPLTDEWMKMMSYLYLRGCVCTHMYRYRYTSQTLIE